MGFMDVGGIQLDGKRIFSWACARKASEEAAQLNKVSQSVYTLYTLYKACITRLLIFVANCSQSSLSVAIFMFSVPKSANGKKHFFSEARNKSKVIAQCNYNYTGQ
jgi:hypothetical protein